MSLKIAFCGPNPELNDTLVHHIKDLIGNEVVDTTIIPNTVREVIETTKRDNWQGYDIDWLNLWSSSYRSILQQASIEDDLVLTPSCNVDQVVMQAAWMSDQEAHLSSGLLIADATGEISGSQEEAMIHRCGSVLQVILNQAEEDVADYWDFVYAVIPADIGASSAPDIVLTQYNEFLRAVPVFQTITKLPDNEDAAKDALEQEVEAWKAKLKDKNG